MSLMCESFCVQGGADVNHQDVEGWSPLRSAAWGGHVQVVRALLAAKAKVRLDVEVHVYLL